MYDECAGKNELALEGESYAYIFKSRRWQKEKNLILSNLTDGKLYEYKITALSRNKARLELVDSIIEQTNGASDGVNAIKSANSGASESPNARVHIIWAIVDSKVVEKTLPFLNELGIGKLSFFYADFSQKNIVLNEARLRKILVHSCEQCGRNELLEIEFLPNLQAVLQKYKNIIALDFPAPTLDCVLKSINTRPSVLIGAEGGLSENERALLQSFSTPCAQIKHAYTLRSESACIFTASILGFVEF
ncbi:MULTISPECIES: RsmE family RNA methyltransferase [unclassified Helicobacter]|uniref:16S rRNA (uracil(1498)-N(3))-methyltransferase n=1 Tax=unclassified Helicobacter TaxID=2593540 RepID=UPI0015F1A0BA|nr:MULTISPECIES: RsmE family RNA methyltransferase [unclassified Helicobacter]